MAGGLDEDDDELSPGKTAPKAVTSSYDAGATSDANSEKLVHRSHMVYGSSGSNLGSSPMVNNLVGNLVSNPEGTSSTSSVNSVSTSNNSGQFGRHSGTSTPSSSSRNSSTERLGTIGPRRRRTSSSSTGGAGSLEKQTRRRRSSSRGHHRMGSASSGITGGSSGGTGAAVGSMLASLGPTHPAQVFRNMLIVEASLRDQYAALSVSRRKQVLFFFSLLALLLYFSYSVFLFPSIYRLVNLFDKLMLLVSVTTLGLFYLSGFYARAFTISPRYMYNTNKALRDFNIKLVRVTPTWPESLIRLLWDPGYSSAPGRLVMLIFSPRSFGADTMQAWEIYREEYWARETRRLLKQKSNKKAKS